VRTTATACWLLALYTAVHVAMLVHDLADHTIWLRADRANERIQELGDFASLGDWPARLTYIGHHNVPGDYLVQSCLHELGGLGTLLVVQVILCLLSVVCVYRMARLTSPGPWLPLVAASIYALLPQTLVYPHQLSAEAWFSPLIVFGFYYTARWIVEGAASTAVRTGLAWAGATLTRPTALPFALLTTLVFRKRVSRNSLALFHLALLIPIAGWMMIVYSSTGHWSFGGGTSSSAGVNLLQRVRYISDTLPPEVANAVEAEYVDPARARDHSMRVWEYASFCVRYLGPCSAHYGRDAVNFFLKSGIERVTLDYLGLLGEEDRKEIGFAKPGSQRGWAQHWREEGLAATVEFYFGKYPLVTGLSLLGSLGFGALMILYCVGTVDSLVGWRTRIPENAGILLAWLAVFPLYLFIASSVVNSMQSRHRAAAEFAVVLVAVRGWQVLSARRLPRADRAGRPS
jgi:hypothetical protein